MSSILKIKDSVSGEWIDVPAIVGPKGEPGNGVASIVKSNSTGLVDTYTVTYTDGTTSAFTVTNGSQGESGKDGYTPVKGTDYYTDTDKQEMVQLVIAALPSAEEVSF